MKFIRKMLALKISSLIRERAKISILMTEYPKGTLGRAQAEFTYQLWGFKIAFWEALLGKQEAL